MRILVLSRLGLCLLGTSLSSCVSYDSGASDNDIGSDNNVITDNSIVTSSDSAIAQGTPCDEFIWKPESESDGHLALIFGSGFPVTFDSVSVERKVPEMEPEQEFLEFSSTDENGRQVWRGDKPGGEYTGSFLVEYGTESCLGEVEKPGERTESGSNDPAGLGG